MFVGQEHIQELFNKFIENKDIPHSFFYGPSGIGKTTYAKEIAKKLNTSFYEFDAANFKLDDLRKISLSDSIFKPVVFIDEVHRLNSVNMDALLKPLEKNTFFFICASTLNPYSAINSALRSRLLFFEFYPLSDDELAQILDYLDNSLSDEVKEFLIKSSSFDARAMINLLENAKKLGELSLENLKKIRAHFINNQNDALLTSAFIKSLRASDTNAALLYLARMIKENYDVLYIARRLVIFASEDISNANPNALLLANACLNCVKQIGYPEARIILSQCVVFLSKCKKSNASYLAINKALDYVKNNKLSPIPKYLDNYSPCKKDYIYPHDNPNKKQTMANNCPIFYEDNAIGYEKNFEIWQKEGLYKC